MSKLQNLGRVVKTAWPWLHPRPIKPWNVFTAYQVTLIAAPLHNSLHCEDLDSYKALLLHAPSFFCFVLVDLEIELRASHLQSSVSESHFQSILLWVFLVLFCGDGVS
jgi:hypothetical protein